MPKKPHPDCRLLSHDPLTGITRWYRYDAETDQDIIQSTADIEAALEANQAMANDPSKPWRKQNMHLVASIPPIIQEKWLREEGIDVFNKDHWPAVQRKLNSREFYKLRTSPTKI